MYHGAFILNMSLVSYPQVTQRYLISILASTYGVGNGSVVCTLQITQDTYQLQSCPTIQKAPNHLSVYK